MSQRLVALHPGCPLSLNHDGAWKLQSYHTEAVLSSSADTELCKAKCSRCGAAVSMLMFDTVSVATHLTAAGIL